MSEEKKICDISQLNIQRFIELQLLEDLKSHIDEWSKKHEYELDEILKSKYNNPYIKEITKLEIEKIKYHMTRYINCTMDPFYMRTSVVFDIDSTVGFNTTTRQSHTIFDKDINEPPKKRQKTNQPN